MKSLEDLTSDHFHKLVGKEFSLDGHPVTLKHVDTRDAPSSSLRAPMSLLFTGSDDIGVVSGTHTLSHPELGDHALLVHRVASAGEPAYEIVFG